MEKYKILISNYKYADYNKSQMPSAALDKYRNSFVLLFNDGWNDMGFYSEFWILYVDREAYYKEIGRVKLCNKEMKLDNVYSYFDNIYPYNKTYYFLKKDKLIEIELSSNKLKNYYSIIGMSTYNSLLNILENDEKVNKFISELNEVNTLPNNDIDKIQNYDWFKESILRDSNNYEREIEIVALTKLKNKLKIKNTTYHFSKEFENLFRTPSPDELKTMHEWLLENTSFHMLFNLANRIVNIMENIINTDTNNDIPFEILKTLKIKLENHTDFVEKIDNILNENKSFYASINKIKNILKVTKKELSELELGHYTSLSTISKLIKKAGSYLRLTNGRQMNDPFEGKNLLEYIFGDSHSDWISTKRFITSLTTVQDSLPMWNNYAEGATGAMLIYDKTYLIDISKLNYIGIYKVAYISLNSEKNEIEIKSKNLTKENKDTLIREIDNLKRLFESEKEKIRVYLNKLQEIEIEIKLKNLTEENKDTLISKINNLKSLFESEKKEKKQVYLNKLQEIEIKLKNLTEENKNTLISEINNLKSLFESEKKEKRRLYLNKLQEIDFLFKKSDYSYESEYRIVANIENKNTQLEEKIENNQLLNFPFLYCYLNSHKIKYSKLFLGPKSISVDYIAPYVNHCDESIKIEISKINFR